MIARQPITIDLNEQFGQLARAPIVEAVIHWRARAPEPAQPDVLRRQLESELSGYPVVLPQHERQVEIGPIDSSPSQTARWLGFRLESQDRRNVAQFTRDGFVFSRLTPYEDWDRFATEAKRLWGIHATLTRPAEIERLGVRFINRIVPIELHELDELLTLPPRAPDEFDLPIQEFLQRSLFDVPGYPYRVQVIKTTQPPMSPDTMALGLIIDIDVFTTETIAIDDAIADTRLAEMRWLKNKAFFSLVTAKALARFGEIGR